MDRFETLAASKRPGHLRRRRFGRGKNDRLDVGPQAVQESLEVGNGRVDKDDLVRSGHTISSLECFCFLAGSGDLRMRARAVGWGEMVNDRRAWCLPLSHF